MMSKAWCVKHGVEKAQDFNAKQETYAVRNANGTGPYRLERYEPDVRTVLDAQPALVGLGRQALRQRRRGDAASSIRSDATRLAALASGEVDLVLDPPFQDVERLKREPALTLLQTADLGQQYLTFDQCARRARGQRRQGPQPVQGPARAPRRLPRDQRRR